MTRGKTKSVQGSSSDAETDEGNSISHEESSLPALEDHDDKNSQDSGDDNDVADEIIEEEIKPTGKLAAKRKSSSATTKNTQKGAHSNRQYKKFNVFAQLLLFFRQVISEMKKVHWITRKQSVVYTVVVLAFVVCCVAYVAGLDVLFQYLMGLIFGDTPRGGA